MLNRRLFPVLDDQYGQRIGRDDQRLGREVKFFDLDNISHVHGKAWRQQTEYPEDQDRDHSREPLAADMLHILRRHCPRVQAMASRHYSQPALAT